MLMLLVCFYSSGALADPPVYVKDINWTAPEVTKFTVPKIKTIGKTPEQIAEETAIATAAAKAAAQAKADLSLTTKNRAAVLKSLIGINTELSKLNIAPDFIACFKPFSVTGLNAFDGITWNFTDCHLPDTAWYKSQIEEVLEKINTKEISELKITDPTKLAQATAKLNKNLETSKKAVGTILTKIDKLNTSITNLLPTTPSYADILDTNATNFKSNLESLRTATDLTSHEISIIKDFKAAQPE